jgi:hypothetical protein
MHGSKKLLARAGDQSFRCYDVDKDPGELTDLGAAACPDLLSLTLSRFKRLPAKR